MDGYERITLGGCADDLLLYCPVVCGRPHRVSLVPHWYQPGQFHLQSFFCYLMQIVSQLVANAVGILQTTYENFRYRPNSRTVAYNRGCANNFMEVFCTKVKPSRNNFRAFVEEEPPRVVTLPTIVTNINKRSAEAEDEIGSRRQKVEDDLDIGDDLMNLSQRCNPAETSNDQPHQTLDIDQLALGVADRAATIRTETRHGSWGRRSGSWDIAADVANSNVRES